MVYVTEITGENAVAPSDALMYTMNTYIPAEAVFAGMINEDELMLLLHNEHVIHNVSVFVFA